MIETTENYSISGAGNRPRCRGGITPAEAARVLRTVGATAEQHADRALAVLAPHVRSSCPTFRRVRAAVRAVHSAVLAPDVKLPSYGAFRHLPPAPAGRGLATDLPFAAYVQAVDELAAAHAAAWVAAHAGALAFTRSSPIVRRWTRAAAELAGALDEIRLTRSLTLSEGDGSPELIDLLH